MYVHMYKFLSRFYYVWFPEQTMIWLFQMFYWFFWLQVNTMWIDRGWKWKRNLANVQLIVMGDYERVRLVTLGGPNVGKSSIVKRFLFNTFSDKYKPTVEDLYSHEYDFGQLTLKVDILDTAGDLQFPAMRRLSIATAHAFLIVYSVNNRESFELAKVFFDEIQEQRADFQDTPIVLTGNKTDLPLETREIHSDEVADWLECSWPTLKLVRH